MDRGVVFFGHTGEGRFDDPEGRFGVLYLGADVRGAFIEVLGGGPSIERESLTQRTASSIVVDRGANVVDLTGPDLSRLGLDARISTGDHTVAQAWSRAFYLHPDQPDGVLYRSRRDPSQLAIALYDRGGWSFDIAPLPTTTLIDLAIEYGLAIT